jgi:hypothetical protein
MDILEKYLEEIQNENFGGDFAIDSLHTRERTLTKAIKDDDIVIEDNDIVDAGDGINLGDGDPFPGYDKLGGGIRD